LRQKKPIPETRTTFRSGGSHVWKPERPSAQAEAMSGIQNDLPLKRKPCLETRTTFRSGGSHVWNPERPSAQAEAMSGIQNDLPLRRKPCLESRTTFRSGGNHVTKSSATFCPGRKHVILSANHANLREFPEKSSKPSPLASIRVIGGQFTTI
jgi:hypothetical protein